MLVSAIHFFLAAQSMSNHHSHISHSTCSTFQHYDLLWFYGGTNDSSSRNAQDFFNLRLYLALHSLVYLEYHYSH